MPTIHPTAIVEPGAEIHDSVEIGPFCTVGPQVRIGEGTRLVSHVVVMGRTTIGRHNNIWPGAILGGDPQDLKFKGEDSELIIGSHNDIRECVTIHKGTANDENVTRVGDHNLIMAYAHVGHDCILHNHVVIANAVQLAGHVLMEDHTNLGGSSAVHHFCTIGKFAFVAGMSGVTYDVPPFTVAHGYPAIPRRINTTLLTRHQFPQDETDRLKKAFRTLYGKQGAKNAEGEAHVGRSSEGLEQLEREMGDDANVMYLVNFVQRSTEGIHGRYREAQRRDSVFSNPVR